MAHSPTSGNYDCRAEQRNGRNVVARFEGTEPGRCSAHHFSADMIP